MSIRTGDNLDLSLFAIGDHIIDRRVQKRFPPIPKDNQEKLIANLIDEFLNTENPMFPASQFMPSVTGQSSHRTLQNVEGSI
jgi:hypothetical protein